ncbi:MAG: selenide, water dikinase SelD [Planctomycetota bacterium]|jgi:selenide,water dikinase
MAIDIKRRKAVMSRSIKLGHCVCNPKLPCPCPNFKEFNVCTCAGEKLPVKKGAVPLTKHVRKAGCASKIGQADLLQILSNLPAIDDPKVLVGTSAGDDAGIYQIDDKHSLVQTVDVFSPCVDDPYLFGQIAASNSLSDVYAMGGKPLTALSVVGFPIEELDGDIMQAMLRGGIDKLNEANCPLVGGHSINDEEIKCGFSITGLIDTERVVERGAARPGDALVLTKPIGTGMVAFAAQIGRADEKALDEVGASMAELNKDAAELMVEMKANACTDITGFGLAGHLVEMCRTSDVNAEIDLSSLPVFAAVKGCVENDIYSGAIENNQEYSMAWVHLPDDADEKNLPVLYDPQTSGGLLISLPEKNAKAMVDELKRRGHAGCAVIGRIRPKENKNNDSKVILVNTRLENFIGTGEVLPKGDRSMKSPKNPSPVHNAPAPKADAPCCANPPGSKTVENIMTPAPSKAEGAAPCCANPTGAELDQAQEAVTHPDALPLFMDFMHKAAEEGQIDARAKKLIWIALSVGFRCDSCLTSHLKSGLEMGLNKAEIEEAANIGIAFGGCSAMLHYRDICKKLKI